MCLCYHFPWSLHMRDDDDDMAQRQFLQRKRRKITIINAKWKTWKTTQEMRSPRCPPPIPVTSYFILCRWKCEILFGSYFLSHKYTYCFGPANSALKFLHSNIVLHTVFVFVFRYLSLSFDRNNIFLWHVCFCHCHYTVLLFLLLCVRWWGWRRWRRSDLFILYFFLFEIIYSFGI